MMKQFPTCGKNSSEMTITGQKRSEVRINTDVSIRRGNDL